MSAVSSQLIKTIKELQSLPSLSNFALAGGTNLALRYNHRKSIDIDLFCNDIIGIKGFEIIVKEIKAFYGDAIFGLDFPCKIDNQFIFLRCFINKSKGAIKIELLQNMKTLFPNEIINGIRLISKKDIGLFKLVSAASRASKKDIYDLDFITDDISIVDLFKGLKIKKQKFNKPTDKTIFDMDEDVCPTINPKLLLRFDSAINTKNARPIHTNDILDIESGSKTWIESRTSWRMKVRKLFRHLDIGYPTN
jgi:Nucleotidyl transferase AbiEii toxin, Type IV TA system